MNKKQLFLFLLLSVFLVSSCRYRPRQRTRNNTEWTSREEQSEAWPTEENAEQSEEKRYNDNEYREYLKRKYQQSWDDEQYDGRNEYEERDRKRHRHDRNDDEWQDERRDERPAESGKGYELPAPLKSADEMILKRAGYTSSYNKRLKVASWVAWHLTADHTSGPHKRKGVEYLEDMDVPAPRSEKSDYWNTGWDRGHQCPSGDNKWSREAQQQCFLYSNMCPQNHDLNGGDWNDLEIKCRTWAQRFGDIYIATGPIFRSQQPRTVGRNKVGIPDAFYKVVLCMRGEPKAIGFIYENKSGHSSIQSHAMSVDEVEKETGIDFFYNLPDDVEKQVESRFDWNEWR